MPFVRKFARQHKSTELAELAMRIAAVVRGKADPFAKVRGMITEMLKKLEKQLGDEMQEKAYCDQEMGKTEAKKADLETGVSKLTNKIDKSAAKSADLKAQVKVLQEELAVAAKEQDAIDKVRLSEHDVYLKAKADLEAGLSGVRKALDILREYYAAKDEGSLLQTDRFDSMLQSEAESGQPTPPKGHEKAGGAGTSIISILEVAESDMATELTKIEAEESDEQAAYEAATQENKVAKVGKDADVKYKSAEAAGLDKRHCRNCGRQGHGEHRAGCSERVLCKDSRALRSKARIV